MLDVDKFTALVEAFVNRTEELTKRIVEFVQTYAEVKAVPEKDPAEGPSLGGLASGFMQI